MIPSHGWLRPRPEIVRDESHFGMYLDPTLDTRWEEYTLARDVLASLPPGRVLDAGAGFAPGIHIMPEIAASLGWEVEAIDALEGRWRNMARECKPFADHPLIHRHERDMRWSGYEDASFDAYLCISTLEHMDAGAQATSLDEARRMLKPGGVVVVTMDGFEPRPPAWLDAGERIWPGMSTLMLTSMDGAPVSYVVGVKR